MEQTFMREKKILPLVLSMSLPMVISMAVNSLYNIIDSYFVAKVSEDAILSSQFKTLSTPLLSVSVLVSMQLLHFIWEPINRNKPTELLPWERC